MKVLHINGSCGLSGSIPLLIRAIRAEMDSRGHSSLSVCSGHFSAHEKDVTHIPHLIDWSLTHPVDWKIPFRALIEKEKPDMIHLHWHANPELVEESLRFASTTMTVHAFQLVCPGNLKYFFKNNQICSQAYAPSCLWQAYRQGCAPRWPPALLGAYVRTGQLQEAVRRLSRIIVPSVYMRDCLVLNGFDTECLNVLPHGIPLPSPRDITSSPELYWLYLGNLTPQKGVHVLLQALHHLKMPITLRIVGEGDADYTAHLKKMAGNCGSHRIVFEGVLTGAEKERLLREAFAVVIPSLWPEVFCVVGIEAMAYAKPVVAFSVGAIPEWLVNGQNGYLVAPGDAARLAGTMDNLAQDRELAKRMGEHGRHMAEERFAIKGYVDRLQDVYGALRHSR